LIEVGDYGEHGLYIVTDVRNRRYKWDCWREDWQWPVTFGASYFSYGEDARKYISENIGKLRERLIALERKHSR